MAIETLGDLEEVADLLGENQLAVLGVGQHEAAVELIELQAIVEARRTDEGRAVPRVDVQPPRFAM